MQALVSWSRRTYYLPIQRQVHLSLKQWKLHGLVSYTQVTSGCVTHMHYIVAELYHTYYSSITHTSSSHFIVYNLIAFSTLRTSTMASGRLFPAVFSSLGDTTFTLTIQLYHWDEQAYKPYNRTETIIWFAWIFARLHMYLNTTSVFGCTVIDFLHYFLYICNYSYTIQCTYFSNYIIFLTQNFIAKWVIQIFSRFTMTNYLNPKCHIHSGPTVQLEMLAIVLDRSW